MTRRPSRSKRAQRLEPRNPVPPVMREVIIKDFIRGSVSLFKGDVQTFFVIESKFACQKDKVFVVFCAENFSEHNICYSIKIN